MLLIDLIKLLPDCQYIQISAVTGDEYSGSIDNLLSFDKNEFLYKMRILSLYSMTNINDEDYIQVNTEWIEGDKNAEQ